MNNIQACQYNAPRLVAYSNTLTQVVALHEALERRLDVPIAQVASSSAPAGEPHRPRSLHQRLTPTEIEALVAAYRAGVRQPVLAEQYGIGLTSVKKLVRQAREQR
jgi:predicted DNA binding protein